MAHFAKLNENNIVLEVVVVNNNALDSSNEELSGIAFLTEWSGGYSNWKKTSYNAATNGYRFNYAGIGHTFDPTKGTDGAFILPKPFNSWILDEQTCQWEAPIPRPNNNKRYDWDEATTSWVEIPEPTV
jgi:hypothetical protein